MLPPQTLWSPPPYLMTLRIMRGCSRGTIPAILTVRLLTMSIPAITMLWRDRDRYGRLQAGLLALGATKGGLAELWASLRGVLLLGQAGLAMFTVFTMATPTMAMLRSRGLGSNKLCLQRRGTCHD